MTQCNSFMTKMDLKIVWRKKKEEETGSEKGREVGVKCSIDIIMKGCERGVSEQVKDGERPSELWGRQRE